MCDTYLMPPHGWTCYFCGETFKTPGAAADHFGSDLDDRPACIEFGEKGTRGLVMAWRKAESRARRAEQKIEDTEYMHSVDAGNWNRIIGLKRAHDVAFELDCMEGRALAAEAIIDDIAKRWPALVEASRRRICAMPSANGTEDGNG